jgi:hypothetical protein
MLLMIMSQGSRTGGALATRVSMQAVHLKLVPLTAKAALNNSNIWQQRADRAATATGSPEIRGAAETGDSQPCTLYYLTA